VAFSVRLQQALQLATTTGVFNRNTSDGTILAFSKDGSTVGSIGNDGAILQMSSASTGGLFVADNGTNVFGFANGENAFRPASDNTINLGKTDRRFKDLYLSGGVNIVSPNTTSAAVVTFGDSADAATGSIGFWNSDDSLRFSGYNNTERMRIASDGDVLIGTTNSNLYQASAGSTADNGFVYGVNDFGTFSRYANDPLILNRTGTDGGILQLRKNGTTVGSIGTEGGDLTVGTGDVGLKFNDAVGLISPWDMTANAPEDNTIDLGYSSGRFKDLYLSGGVYLGGTGAANKLDDVETGTFTATLKGSTGEPATLITATYAKYTKVGDTVFIEISYENVNTTGYSGNISIDTLPFTSGTGRSVLNVAHYQTSSWGTTDIPIALIGGSTTTVSFLNYRSGTTWQTTTHSAGSGRYLWITGTYKV
jgi:hypothetical protein